MRDFPHVCGTVDTYANEKWQGHSVQTCQVSRNFRESPEIGRDLQVSRNCKENSRNRVNLIAKFSLRKKCEFWSYFLSKMCVSTHEYHLMVGKNLISQLEITEKPCHYPPPRRPLEITDKFCYYPPPLNRVGFWRSRKRLKKLNNLNLAALLCTQYHPVQWLALKKKTYQDNLFFPFLYLFFPSYNIYVCIIHCHNHSDSLGYFHYKLLNDKGTLNYNWYKPSHMPSMSFKLQWRKEL